ncbi:hypothetical protein FB639_001020 [Coemansia asiatica]|nr:hypothetical protein FB639_001020 [Coemansia asiatica]
MDILSRLRDRVLAEPQEYVKSLVSGKEPAAPCQQEVVDIPLINMEPYVLFAHPAVSESYIRSLRGRSASSRGDISAATHSGALSKPSVTGAMTNTSGANGLRSLGVDKSAGVSGKAGKYALRHNHSVSPSAALPGPLTGNTAVATPEQSPPRPQSSAGHLSNINNGISTPSTAIAAIAAISAIPVTASSRILASSADSHAEQSSSVPPIGRSNTEPVHRHAAAQSVPGTPTAKTRSITPSRSGKTGGSGSGSGSGSGKKMDGRGKKRKYVDFTSSSGESSGSEDIEIDLGGETSEGEGQAFGAAVPYDHKGKQADRSAGTALDSANDLYGFANDDDFLKAVVGEGGSGSMVDSQRFFNPASTSKANQQSLALRSAKAVHLGYRCDSCLAEPIVGIRWHCMECRGAHAVDLCDECREEGNFETGWHNTAHTFHAVREAEMEPYYANEVASCALQEYSYLA